MSDSFDLDIDARSRRVLRSLIAQYLADGEPVGSRTLARSGGLSVSPATIRNIMADLEEFGLVMSPHTSAGRIPTARGLRLFVDSLVELEPVSRRDREQLRQGMAASAGTAQDIMSSTSSLLSAVTQFVGVVTVPGQDGVPLQHIDFVPLSEARVLVILVFADHQVQNRVVHLEKPLAATKLEHTANYLNTHFAGLRLESIRRNLRRELRQAGSDLNRKLSETIELTSASFAGQDGDGDVLVSGQTNLMDCAEMADIDRLRDLFEAFQRKHDMLQLMDMCARARGVQLFIGEESGYTALDGCSVVTATYETGGRVLGSVGVIGPTRMAYERVIPVVRTTAALLGDALSGPTTDA